jgi:hypothetical protein
MSHITIQDTDIVFEVTYTDDRIYATNSDINVAFWNFINNVNLDALKAHKDPIANFIDNYRKIQIGDGTMILYLFHRTDGVRPEGFVNHFDRTNLHNYQIEYDSNIPNRQIAKLLIHQDALYLLLNQEKIKNYIQIKMLKDKICELTDPEEGAITTRHILNVLDNMSQRINRLESNYK